MDSQIKPDTALVVVEQRHNLLADRTFRLIYG